MNELTPESQCKQLFFQHRNLEQSSCDRFLHVSRTYPYIVTARAKDRSGREDESTGAVALGTLKGDALANALMKCETKAKRRVTLSIAGLGWLDETEVASIPGAQPYAPDAAQETPGMSHPHLVGAEGTPGASPTPHPSADEITTLVESAKAANVSLEDFGADMRRLMSLPESQRITKKFLREQMSIDQYNQARKVYGDRLAAILSEDVPNHEPPQTASQFCLPQCGVKPTLSVHRNPANLHKGVFPWWKPRPGVVGHGC